MLTLSIIAFVLSFLFRVQPGGGNVESQYEGVELANEFHHFNCLFILSHGRFYFTRLFFLLRLVTNAPVKYNVEAKVPTAASAAVAASAN